MADAIISAVTERLMAILEEKMRNEVSLARGVKKEARKLSNELRSVRNVLDDAERRGFKDKIIREWLKRLEYASYEMDDVLDEWNLSLIKLQKEQQDSSSVAPPQHKVCPFIPCSSCRCFKKKATLREIALKMKHVQAQLDMILMQRNRYDFLENQETDHSLQRVTTSFVEIDDIKGRDIDRDKLVSKIISHSTTLSQGDQLGLIHISSIVGTGGIGKTTLAQLVYNDVRIQKCFSLRIWICVSDPFDEASIAREIVGKAGGSASSINSFEGLLALVQESISEKKFLLVLDDVWNGDDAKWGPLKRSLKSSCVAGSRILLTTRNVMVARNIGTNENEIYHLEQLSDHECWSLLSHIALSERSEGTKEGFFEIGRGIAQKCSGLPLAAKTLGSFLRFRNTVKEWKDVLNSEIWRLESMVEDLFAHLFLSYYDLSPAQKHCFSYCAVFPKDHEIYVDDLIRKWMALGYLSSSGGNASELERRGREYFDSLANRCLFQNFEKDRFNAIHKSKMHGIVHDFAQYLRKEPDDLKSSEEASSCEICSPIVSRVREYHSLLLIGDNRSDLHVCDYLTSTRVLDCERFRNISMKIEKFIHLRNLRFYRVAVNENNIKTICMLFKLQSLVLSNCGVREIPSEIGYLSELRHLDLSSNEELKELPESINDLRELRSLDVTKCESPFGLPQGIDGLINLKHLQMDSPLQKPVKYPRGLAKLTSLQTLYEFYGGGDWNKLGLLNKLNQLSGFLNLRIKLVDDDDDIVEQGREAELRQKTLLQTLTIVFEDRMDEENKEEAVSMKRRWDVMEALEPHQNLQSLEIELYMGSRFPEWIASPSFYRLREIRLHYCDLCLSFPHLGKLSCLEELVIWGFEKVEFVEREFLGITSSSSSSQIGFPKLKKLLFWSCSNWKEWEDLTATEEESTAVSVMPSLMELEIWACRNLRELPHRLLRKASSLQRLTISDSHQLRKSYKEGALLNKFISHIPNVELY